jgi:hypothetical protein
VLMRIALLLKACGTSKKVDSADSIRPGNFT